MELASEAPQTGTSYEATRSLKDALYSLQLKSDILVSCAPNIRHAFQDVSVAGAPSPARLWELFKPHPSAEMPQASWLQAEP